MKNYEDKIYSLGETVTGQTQAMSQAVQKTLENNGGVGIMTGYYDQNLSVLSVSNLLLHSTGYTFDSFMEQTKGSLKNFFYGDDMDILDYDRFLQQHPQLIRVGYCPSMHVAETLPREETDCPVQYLITEQTEEELYGSGT